MMRRFAAILLFCVASQAWGQDAKPVHLILEGEFDIVKVRRFVPVDEDRQALKKIPFTIKIPAEQARGAEWTVPAGVTFTKSSARSIQITSAPKGELTVSVFWEVADWDAKKFIEGRGTLTFLVGDVPAPIPPVPPVPPTPPVPPEPPPSPSPFPVGAFRVLVIYKQLPDGKADITPAQYNELYGAEVYGYLEAKAKGQWRIWPDDVKLANAPEVFRQAIGRNRQSLPWIVIGDGKTGFEGPLPTGGGILPLLKKYGG